MSSSVRRGERPIEQARNAGVPPPPAHVGPNAAAVVGLLEESLGQPDPDSSRRRPFPWSPDQLFPDDSSSIRRSPPVVQRRPMDAVGGRREDGPDLPSPNSGSHRPAQDRPGDAPAEHWWPSASSCSHRPAQGRPGDAPAEHWWLVAIGFCFLTFNSGMAIYQAWGDAQSISFVASTYLTMVSLFFIIRKFQAAPPNSRRRKGLMVGVWIFGMSLAFGFVYQIIGTTAKPTLNLTLLLWAMPAGTGISVFIIFWDRSGARPSEELLDV